MQQRDRQEENGEESRSKGCNRWLRKSKDFNISLTVMRCIVHSQPRPSITRSIGVTGSTIVSKNSRLEWDHGLLRTDVGDHIPLLWEALHSGGYGPPSVHEHYRCLSLSNWMLWSTSATATQRFSWHWMWGLHQGLLATYFVVFHIVFILSSAFWHILTLMLSFYINLSKWINK